MTERYIGVTEKRMLEANEIKTLFVNSLKKRYRKHIESAAKNIEVKVIVNSAEVTFKK